MKPVTLFTPRPSQDFVPAPGSPRYERSRVYWDNVSSQPCLLCGQPISYLVWVLRWDRSAWAHLSCQDEQVESERKLRANPFLAEESARAAGLTIAQFLELPSWERQRRNQATLDAREASDTSAISLS